MNYSDSNSIIELGGKARDNGISNLDCPIDRRTHANAAALWQKGWNEEPKKCKGAKCTAVRGIGHSKECEAEHEVAYQCTQ